MDTIDVSNINLFKEYIKANNESFSNNLHIPYLIGSPIQLFKDSSASKKNDALIPIVVLIKNADGTIDFDEVVFNWNSIDLLQTYSKIESGGQLNYLSNYEKFESLFDEEKLEVDINNVKEITLKDVINDYQFYRRLSSPLMEKYKDEKFLQFSYNQNNYIIPAIEVVRYFYCNSNSDSLKQAMFYAGGMKLLVDKCTKHTDRNRYDLYLRNLCEIIDNKKVFYFTHDEKYLEMFHNVYHKYKNHSNPISAQFPFKNNFSMLCKTLKLSPDSNDFLITKVVDSSMMNNFFTETGIELHVHHPQSKEKEDSTGKRNKDYDVKRRVPKNIPSDFNDQLSSSSSIPTQIITNEENIEYFPEEDISSIVESKGKRKERGGKTIVIPVDVGNLSTGDNKGDGKKTSQQAKTTSQKNKINEYPTPISSNIDGDFNGVSQVKKEFKKKGFIVNKYKIFDFPDKTNGQKKVISYTDKTMIVKRRYVVLEISKNNKRYIYIEVEKTKQGNKEILVLINQDETIAHKCIYQQVHYGNHKWLSKDSMKLVEDIDFVRIRHSATSKQLVENIIDKVR